jgi:hypothetical protein
MLLTAVIEDEYTLESAVNLMRSIRFGDMIKLELCNDYLPIACYRIDWDDYLDFQRDDLTEFDWHSEGEYDRESGCVSGWKVVDDEDEVDDERYISGYVNDITITLVKDDDTGRIPKYNMRIDLVDKTP